MNKPTQQQIRQLREEFGLSKKDFGAITHVTERAVSAWEYGERQMNEVFWEMYQIYFCRQESRRYSGATK